MKKIGFLGGTFDPIHFGHVHLGIQLQEFHKLDEVIVCPAARSPLKNMQPQEGHHRLKMVELAIQDIPGWSALDWEVRKEGPSYTIDTIQHLLKDVFNKSSVQLHLLLGEDVLQEISLWKNIDELFEIAPPLIGCRGFELNKSLPDFLQKGMTPTKVLEISATEIRDRLKKRLYCGHLIPSKVLDYIHQHHLY